MEAGYKRATFSYYSSTTTDTWVDASNVEWIDEVEDYGGWDAPDNERY